MNNKLSPDDIYNNSTIRNVTVIFGSVFSNIKINKFNSDGTVSDKKFLVPIAYVAKDQYGYWIEQTMRLPTGNIEINTKLPRMSFEMESLSMSPERGVNTNLPLLSKRINNNSQLRSRGPISYSFDFTLTIWGKQMNDSIQVLEEILPLFCPEISIKIKESKQMNIVNDVKIVLNSINKDDNYQSGFEENRFIAWNLSFTVYADIIPKYEPSTIIKNVIIETSEKIIDDYSNGITPEFINGKYDIDTKEVFNGNK